MGQLRIGLDVGGTFTDVVAVDEATGATSWIKVTTRTDSAATGVLEAIAATGADCREIESVRLGTTLGVNAVLTRSGARTGLITTRGFQRRARDPAHAPPAPVRPERAVPRRRSSRATCALEVTERVDAEGDVIEPLDEDGVRAAWRQLRDAGVEALAIVFLFSFENPEHERRAREIVLEEGGAETVLISSDVLPVHREYERTSTTVAGGLLPPTIERTWPMLPASSEIAGSSAGAAVDHDQLGRFAVGYDGGASPDLEPAFRARRRRRGRALACRAGGVE